MGSPHHQRSVPYVFFRLMGKPTIMLLVHHQRMRCIMHDAELCPLLKARFWTCVPRKGGPFGSDRRQTDIKQQLPLRKHGQFQIFAPTSVSFHPPPSTLPLHLQKMATQYRRSPLFPSLAFPIAAVSDKLDGAKPPTGIDLYSRFALAGAVCCSVTHGALTPVDVVKTRIQLEPEIYNKVS